MTEITGFFTAAILFLIAILIVVAKRAPRKPIKEEKNENPINNPRDRKLFVIGIAFIAIGFILKSIV